MKQYKQLYQNDCAIVIMLFILNQYLGIDLSRNELINQVEFNIKGLSTYSMVTFFKKYLPNTNAYSTTNIDYLKHFPSILLLQKNEYEIGHFVIYIKKTKNKILIYDPFKGYEKINKKKLYKIWKGIFIDFGVSLKLIKKKTKKENIKVNRKPLFIYEFIELGLTITSLYYFTLTLKEPSINNILLLAVSIIFYFTIIKLKLLTFKKVLSEIDKKINHEIVYKLFNLPNKYLKSISSIDHKLLFLETFKYRKILIEGKNFISYLIITIVIIIMTLNYSIFWGILFLTFNLIYLSLTFLINKLTYKDKVNLHKIDESIQEEIRNFINSRDKINNYNYYESYIKKINSLYEIEAKLRKKTSIIEGINKLLNIGVYIIIITLSEENLLFFNIALNQILNYLLNELGLIVINNKENELITDKMEDIREIKL